MRDARHRRTHSREHGFTLIELLVVILIVGLLASIAIPVFLQQRRKAHVAALRTEVRAVAQAYDDWAAGHPGATYPDLYHRWNSGTTNNNVDGVDAPLSSSTQIHAFDMAVLYPLSGYTRGEAYCIEAIHERVPGSLVYYHSARGGFRGAVACQTP